MRAGPGSDVDVTLNSSAFVHMRNTVETLMAEGVFPPGDSTTMALELWTAAHGVAAMLISRPYLPWGDAEEFADRVLRAVCFGHIVSGAIGPDDRTAGGDRRLKGCWMSNTVDNPFFARLWTVMSGHETEAIQRLRQREPGRAVRPGAGGRRGHRHAISSSIPDTVTEVVAVEPERRLAELAATGGRRSAGARHRQHRHASEQFSGSEPVRRGGVLAGVVLGR